MQWFSTDLVIGRSECSNLQRLFYDKLEVEFNVVT
jgi:hypothetical protein